MYSKMVGPKDKRNQWLDSKQLAIELTKTKWVRIVSNMEAKSYEAIVALGEMPDPVWPPESFEELVQLAFRDHYISDRNHPALKKLRGEL